MKPLPIGKSNFKQLIEEGCYYVDKTGAIEELFEKKSTVDVVNSVNPLRKLFSFA